MARILIIAIIIFSISGWLYSPKDYQQCRWTSDPIMCVEIIKGMQNDK